MGPSARNWTFAGVEASQREQKVRKQDNHSVSSPGPEAEPAAVGGVFTHYVRELVERSEDLNHLVDEMMAELRIILVRELRMRSLWTSPPSYIGVLGWPRWTSDGTQDPLDELLSDCYTFIFCDRLTRLIAQLRRNASIDGLVRFYLRNFLYQRQKDHDPLGYRVFEMLCSAVRAAVASGELYVLRGTPKIRNGTILGLAPYADMDLLADASELSGIVARWNDELLPDHITSE